MKKGTKVLYESEIYMILWIYDDGWCEISKDSDPFKVDLVKIEELTPLE
ncbi:hypothetical protein ACJROX_07080 [Pseudalkalibacillus sp. A8]